MAIKIVSSIKNRDVVSLRIQVAWNINHITDQTMKVEISAIIQNE